jgi:uncharacterized protein YdaL
MHLRHVRVPMLALAVSLAGGGSAATGCRPESPPVTWASRRSHHPARDTLVLYDDTGPYAWLGELYGAALAALAGHFGGWSAAPVSRYRRGDLLGYRAAVYVGSTYDQPIPAGFLDDVLDGARPVLWIDDNVWELAARARARGAPLAFEPAAFDTTPVAAVRYKGVELARSASNTGGIMGYASVDAARASVQAWAVRADATTFPWALRAGSLLYVGENPLAYVGPNDRYLALCDLLFEVLAPGAVSRHRALVRIEDVSPRTSPTAVRAIADALAAEGIPFAVAVIPVFRAPPREPGGAADVVSLREVPAMVDALRYALDRGATLVLHGFTHQYRDVPNPYDGVSARDFEFFRAHLGPEGGVVLDGPVAEDSAAWALARVDEALREFDAARLPRPRIFEYPHYAGSTVDSRAIAARFDTAYQRESYFAGVLAGGGESSPARSLGLFFPFTVVDAYGWRVLPESLGHYAPPGGPEPRSPSDLVESARRQRVVRDGVASFFFHPTFDPAILRTIVDGLRADQYVFVGADELRRESLEE